METINVQLSDWHEAIELIEFLNVRGLHGFPLPEGGPVVRVVCPVPAAAHVETFVALHSFLDSGPAEELTVRLGTRTLAMRRKLHLPAEPRSRTAVSARG